MFFKKVRFFFKVFACNSKQNNMILLEYDIISQLTTKELCSNIEIIRDEKVTDIQPSVIRAYEYYRPG